MRAIADVERGVCSRDFGEEKERETELKMRKSAETNSRVSENGSPPVALGPVVVVVPCLPGSPSLAPPPHPPERR